MTQCPLPPRVGETAAILINILIYLPGLEAVIPVLFHPFSTNFTLGTGGEIDIFLVENEFPEPAPIKRSIDKWITISWG